MIAPISIEEAAISLAEQLDLATPEGFFRDSSLPKFRLGFARIRHHKEFEQRLVDMVNDGRLMARSTSGLSRPECKGIATTSTLVDIEEAKAQLASDGTRFIDDADTSAAQPRPKKDQRHQEDEILRVIRDLKHDPKQLPKNQPGKPGVKADVRVQLAFSTKVFDKAWERLRADGSIADK